MSLKITNSETNGTSVVTVDGCIVLGDEGDALREKLTSFVAIKLIEFIDSAGLGTLFAAHLSAQAEGASLKLCNLGCRLQEVLHTTRLATSVPNLQYGSCRPQKPSTLSLGPQKGGSQ